jgi:ubiquinone/menaquinone biosynthesis C-methylase UbiE
MNSQQEIKKAEIGYYDFYAEHLWQRSQKFNTLLPQYVHSKFLRWLSRLDRDTLILEIGGGLGSDAVDAARMGFYVTESDIATGNLQIARKQFEEQNLTNSASFVLSDGEKLPFVDESFNCILTVACLHHLPDFRRCLSEIYRCLKPKGYFIIGQEPNRSYLRKQLRTGFIKYLITFGVRLYSLFFKSYVVIERSPRDQLTEGFTKDEMLKALGQSGFRVLQFNFIFYISSFFYHFGLVLPDALQKMVISIDEVICKLPLLKGGAGCFQILS